MAKTTKNKKKEKSVLKQRKQYTTESFTNALLAIRQGMSKKLAAKTFGVPKSTLIFRAHNPNKQEKPGPATYLTAAEENDLIQWIQVNAKKGFPKRKEDLFASVAEYLKKTDRPNPFKNGVPGEKWYQLFLNRHQELTLRTPEAVTAPSSCVAEGDIRRWFLTIETYLKDNGYSDILKDPSRILNCDETNFQLCPKTGKVLSIRGEKNVYEVDRGQAKSSLTVMFSFKADGEQTPPLIIYPNKRLPKDIAMNVPPEWGIGLSDNGWMKTEIFLDLRNILHPYLKKSATKFPVILFVDGHKTHVTLSVSELCSELQIILIALYPNATRILQPADVAAFKPLKNSWKKSVLEWRRSNPSQALKKTEFAPILKAALERSIRPQISQNGFRASGLFPWQPDSINYDKCLGKTTKQKDSTDNIYLTREDFIKTIQKYQNEYDILKNIFEHFHVKIPQNKEQIQLTTCSNCSNYLLTSETSPSAKVSLMQGETTYFKTTCSPKRNNIDNSGNIVHDISIPETFNMQDYNISDLPVIVCSNDTLEIWNDSQEETFPENNKSRINCLKKINLKDTFIVTKTPARKGVKNTEKNSFVLTSREFINREKSKANEKQKKIEDVKKRKEDRILKKKQKLEQEQQKKVKRVKGTKNITILSNICLKSLISTLNVNPIDTSDIKSSLNGNKENRQSHMQEQINKVKTQLNFEEKEPRKNKQHADKIERIVIKTENPKLIDKVIEKINEKTTCKSKQRSKKLRDSDIESALANENSLQEI